LAKLNLSDITSGYATVDALNANFAAIETALENTVSRDGAAPNSMSANIDMNSNHIINAASVRTDALYLDGAIVDVADLITVPSADQVAYTAEGTGAAVTTVEAALNSAQNPVYQGAVGDGITDSTTALNNTHNGTDNHDPINVPAGTFMQPAGLLSLRNKVEGGATSTYKATAPAAATDFQVVGTRTIIRDMKFVGEGLQTLSQGSNTEHTLLDNIHVENNKAIGTGGGNVIRLAGSVPVDYKLVNSVVTGTGYAFTLDADDVASGYPKAAGGHGVVLANNYITSDDADAIELNVPRCTFTDATVVGNISSNSGTLGSTSGRGFTYGVAGLQNWTLVGNVSMESRKEAFHLEDAIKQFAVVGNVGRNCYLDGIYLIPDPQGDSRGAVIVANSLEQKSGVSGSYGAGLYTVPFVYTGATIVNSGTTATVTLAQHGLEYGDTFVIAGASLAANNGTFTVASRTSGDVFTYTMGSSPGSNPTGTITVKRAITSITRSGSTATATTPMKHGLYTGSYVVIEGANETAYNETIQITRVSDTVFTFPVTGTPATPATGTLTYYAGSRFSPPGILAHNVFKDFDVGIAPNTFPLCIADGNIVEEATTAVVSAASNATVVGETVAVYQDGGVPATLVLSGAAGSTVGKIYSTAKPTTYITQTSPVQPATLKGFYHPIADFIHTSGTVQVPIITLPSMLEGRITIKLRYRTVDSAYITANIRWDGTTLVVDNEFRRNVGSFGGNQPSFTVTGGVLYVNLFRATGVVVQGDVDFDGIVVNY
jgi:hypothetical protein